MAIATPSDSIIVDASAAPLGKPSFPLMMEVPAFVCPPCSRLQNTTLSKRLRLAILGGLIWGNFAGVGRAQNHFIESARPGVIETGAPLFDVRNYQTLGLDAPPSDLHVLPDGRLLLIAGQQIAIGDGVRWERFQQAANDPLIPAETVAVDRDGRIYMGVAGGFARVEFGHDARWHLQLVAPWSGEEPSRVLTLRFAVQMGDDWFWHGDSGPLVGWRPGQSASVMGRADTTEQVLRLRDSFFMSDRTTGSLWRISPKGMEPVEYTPGFTSRDTFSCAIPFGPDQLLVGTFGRGLKLFDGHTIKDFPNAGHLGEDVHVNALCEIRDGLYAAAVESYGLIFFDRAGRTIQVLDHKLDHQLNHIRLLYVSGSTVVGLLSEGIVRVEFPSRISYYEPIAATRLTTADPLRIDGQLWLSADGNMMRGQYDEHGMISGFKVDTPPGKFVFYVSNGLGTPLLSTERGTYGRNQDRWDLIARGLSNMRVISDKPYEGKWMYAVPGEIGWLRPDAPDLVVERFAAPALGNPYGYETDADGTTWIEQGNARVVRVQVKEGRFTVEPYGKDAGIPEGWAQIFSLDGRVNFNIGGQILRFVEKTRRFEPDPQFARDFPGIINVTGRPGRDALGRVWIAANGVIKILEGERGNWRELNEPMPPGFLPYAFAFEKNGVVWMHSDRRLVRFDPSMPQAPVVPFHALFSHLNFVSSGRTVFPPAAELPPLDSTDNSFSAHFVAPNCPFGSAVDFEVKLDGVDSRWLSTGAVGSATFNHLKPGRYALHVRPRAAGIVGGEASLGFTVLPPWYLTRWAYLGYVLGIFGLASLIVRAVSILERREKLRLELLVEQRTQELNAGIERRRRLEAQLLQAQKLESLGTLAGGIAHDFNNILTSILGYCGLAVLSAGNNSALIADLNQIRAAGVRARDLVAQILTFSRQRKVTLVPLNLSDAVADALKLVRASTPTTVEIVSHLTAGNVQADSTQIHQIVINLCQNAVHAMRGRSGRIDVSLERVEISDSVVAELPGFSTGPAMRLTVADNGCGMAAATLERVFDPFFTTKSPGEGTGLGLSIVQGIVHSHHGVVRVRSQPGLGTTFDLFFPVTTVPVPVAAVIDSLPRGNQESILVVDDEPSVAAYVAKQLEHLGYVPTVFTDPHAALSAVTSEPLRFRAIVTDLTMPSLTGVELVQRCRAAGANMPVVIITGYGTDALQATLQSLSHCKVLPKPFEGADLARILKTVLRDGSTSPVSANPDGKSPV